MDNVIGDIRALNYCITLYSRIRVTTCYKIPKARDCLSWFRENKRWASLIVLADISDKPDDLTKVSLSRAEICELLVRISGKGNIEKGFLVGIFHA